MLLEQMFQLKHFGKLSLWEQNQLTAEDRRWYLERLEKQQEDERKELEKQSRRSGR